MKYVIPLVALLTSTMIMGQTIKIKGKVFSGNDEGVPFANMYVKAQGKGTSTDQDGGYVLNVISGKISLRLSAVGYEQQIIEIKITSDTILNILMKETQDLLNEIVVSGTLNEISKSESAIPIEVYSAQHLNKVPVAGLLEATQNINGVRPQLNCAICNTGDIHINGMEGPYTMVTIDGMPLVGGLATVYGLQGIPNSLLERIEVVKGPASTLYGSEAVAGLINVITKRVEASPDFTFDVSATSWREIQTDFMVKYAEKKKVKGIFGVDYHNYTKPIDKNGDNFTDLTLKNRVSVFNKLQFERKNNRIATITTRYMYEDRWGGEMQWTREFRGGDSIYGESIYTSRAEILGNYELPLKEKIIFSGSYSYHYQDSKYGTINYLGKQHLGYGQLVWHKNAGSRNKLISGIALRYNYYDDNTIATERVGSVNAPDSWVLPGVFVQDNISLSDNLNMLIGLRGDYHQKHGGIFSPRANWKWNATKSTFIRLGYGNGFRVVNIFTEDHAALNGARDVVFKGELAPEKSHNLNLNIEKNFNTKFSFITLDGSLFYTYFSNRIVPDYETNDEQIIYSNLKGYGISKGISLNTRFIFEFPLRVSIGATLLDVYDVYMNELGILKKNRQMFTEPYTAVWSVSYRFTKYRLSIDYTGNLYGPMKLPLLENDFRDEYSPVFSIQNVKISKDLKKGFKTYFGVRNLLDYTPADNSIMRAHDPFDKLINDPVDNPNNYSFDPTYIYTSFQGVTFFIGLKYEFNKK